MENIKIASSINKVSTLFLLERFQILASTDPRSKLLHDAIDWIPDYGFINNPEQRRNALHNKIKAVEKMVEKGNLRGAINKLKFDIKDKLEKWLIDDYPKEEIEQFSKEEILELINEIIRRLNLMLKN